AGAAAVSSASTFRNVSACNRCRLRKNRCDQRLPACASCEKAHVKCVGYDPITKKEIPRSYVYYLESRVSYLESLLRANGISFTPPENFTLSFKPDDQHNADAQNRGDADGTGQTGTNARQGDQYDREKLNKLVSNIGMVSVQGASDPRYLGSTSGISFARVVFAAVKSSVSGAASERSSVRPSKPLTAGTGSTSMRDSFFGLQTKPTIRQAPFPDRELAMKLVELYFEHANPQIPILHRGEFMALFEKAYQTDDRSRTPRESYMLNIVFAIGSGIIVGATSDADNDSTGSDQSSTQQTPPSPPSQKRRKLSSHQHQPEEYHASAIVHLESFLGSSPAADRPDGFGGGLEELQAVLLLAGFALLRPVAPGLWYIIGVAVRLAVDLGLHYEDGVSVDGNNPDEERHAETGSRLADNGAAAPGLRPHAIDAREIGRRQWVRDLRRRLWWCVYSFDRLVSTCVGRPFGITDTVVTTEFPSLLDDKYITTAGFRSPPNGSGKPSYKFVAHHYFRLRLLQSEILQVLQHRQAQQVRSTTGTNMGNEFMHTRLSSPFLEGFASFRDWRHDIDRRLLEWKDSAPKQAETGVQFQPLFLELNYWQAVIMLYRQSLTVPPVLAGELGSANDDVQSPAMVYQEEREDEEHVFLKVAEAGQNVLKIYRKLHRLYLVNYTYLATHHLFMAGISFLYAIWHSTAVRSLLSVDDFDFTVLAATSVLGDLTVQCPPAEACRDAFERMSRATIQMVLSTTGFGSPAKAGAAKPSTQQQPVEITDDAMSVSSMPQEQPASQQLPTSRMPYPRFDMDLRDLFTDDETAFRQFVRPSMNVPFMMQQQQAAMARQNTSNPPPTFSPSLKQEEPLSATSGMSNMQLSSPTLSQASSHMTQQAQHTSPNFTQISNQMPYASFAQNIQSTYPDMAVFSELDWLDSFPVGSGTGAPSAANSNFAAGGAGAASGNGDGGMGEVELGFGMGWDVGVGNHDWADGSGLDLFDGFFFGNGAGGGGGAGM
ncbi:hypothetical protein NA57DRAFT_17572, partial [Rhizodiscina lignyota]